MGEFYSIHYKKPKDKNKKKLKNHKNIMTWANNQTEPPNESNFKSIKHVWRANIDSNQKDERKRLVYLLDSNYKSIITIPRKYTQLVINFLSRSYCFEIRKLFVSFPSFLG